MLSQAHPWATAIAINELDAGGFQCAPKCQVVGYG